jgi:hypothetical protein
VSKESFEQALAEAARVRAGIQAELERLVGLPLSIARLMGSMRGFHFGAVRPLERGTGGEFALHVSCPWRLDHVRGAITGSDDLWTPADPADAGPDWDWEERETFQDRRLGRVMRGFDPATGSHVNPDPDRLTVERVEAGDHGEAALYLRGGYRLILFPAGAANEAWRLFRPHDGGRPHFVVEGDGRAGEEG